MRFTTSELAAATGGEVFGRETEVDGRVHRLAGL
jgi:hypothetical protein